MSKVTDLRALVRPTLVTILPDEDATVVHITAPTVDMVEELQTGKAALFSVLKGEEGEAKVKHAVYELTAKMLSCNLDGYTFTAKELLTRYNMTPEVLAVFFTDYIDFITTLEKEKN